VTDHRIAELLPFYANGTLDDAERARVEAELASCTSCAAELRELQSLGVALKARADDAPPLAQHVIDDALARISAAPVSSAATTLRTAWWGTPARYATAAALVVGFGAAAAAAYHAHEVEIARTTAGVVATTAERTTTIFRVTPAPNGTAVATKTATQTAANPAPDEKRNATESAPASAKHHRLAKKARLDLLVRDVERSLKQAQSVVRDAGGDVVALDDSSPHTGDAIHEAKLDVEVPANALDATLDRLAAIGTVQNRAIDADDVDATIVDEEARLRNLRREEADLRNLMDKGGKVDEILTVQQNLSDVRGQIEELDAQHAHDLHRVATSTISLAISEDRPNAVPAKPGPTARIDGAWHSGLNALADTVVALLTTIVWCVAYAPFPLALGGLAYLATRLLKKRAAAV
jgi:hypothetical protein